MEFQEEIYCNCLSKQCLLEDKKQLDELFGYPYDKKKKDSLINEKTIKYSLNKINISLVVACDQ